MSVRRKNNTNSINESNLTFNLKLWLYNHKQTFVIMSEVSLVPNSPLYIVYPLADAGLGGPGPDEAASLPPAQPAHTCPASIVSPDYHQL